MSRNAPQSRNASILVCVIVCIGIATAIVSISARSSLRVRRQVRHEIQLEQTRWLVDSGVRRALAQLRQDPDYEGETWQVTPVLQGYENATVEIVSLADDMPANRVGFRVSAAIDDRNPRHDVITVSTTRSRTVFVDTQELDSHRSQSDTKKAMPDR